MIEQGLYFTLGFVTAALLALVILPAFWRRAHRLVRREIEATLPLSPTEIAAERDQLRAKFAVERVQLEQVAEKAREGRQKALAQAGEKALRVTDLEDRVTARDQTISGFENKVAGLEKTLTTARGVIEEQRASLEAAQHTIATTEANLASLSGDHRALGETSDARRLQIAALETNLEAQRARVAELDRDLKAARATLRTQTEDIRAKERRLRDLEKELLLAARKLESAEEIAEKRAEIISERDAAAAGGEERLAALQREARSRDDIIRRETRRADTAQKQAEELKTAAQKARDEAQATATDLVRSADKLRAERQKLQADLTEARSKAAQLQRELTTLKRAPAGKVTDLRTRQAGSRT